MSKVHSLKKDDRYTIAKEWCGHPQMRWVIRFCGEWVGYSPHLTLAINLAQVDYEKRKKELQEDYAKTNNK